MNTRRFPRTLNEAFPHGPDYGCAITHCRKRTRSIGVGALIVAGLFALGLLMGAAA